MYKIPLNPDKLFIHVLQTTTLLKDINVDNQSFKEEKKLINDNEITLSKTEFL